MLVHIFKNQSHYFSLIIHSLFDQNVTLNRAALKTKLRHQTTYIETHVFYLNTQISAFQSSVNVQLK